MDSVYTNKGPSGVWRNQIKNYDVINTIGIVMPMLAKSKLAYVRIFTI